MATTQDFLQGALAHLNQQLTDAGNDGRVAGVPAHMLTREKGLIAALKNAAEQAPHNVHISRALDWMERLHHAAGNPVRNLAQANPGSPQVGLTASYRQDLQQAVNFVQQALQQVDTPARNPAPLNGAGAAGQGERAGWSIQDWMEKAPEDLKAMADKEPDKYRALVSKGFPSVGKS
ncbi:hypothetical protein [Hymenobacter sp. IS2118]|uniref:hypothetical protein n=1 Tax=Hymenobacter sp. IS2118 TaxID=1505605 RepID=UPI000550154B|nr:hypothetical protein [Hymenobacter sp. IS2118]